MDNSGYIFWRFIVFGTLEALTLTLLLDIYAGFWNRFGIAIGIAIIFGVIIESILKKKSNKVIIRDAREGSQKFLRIIIRAGIIATAAASVITYYLSGENYFIIFENNRTIINNIYVGIMFGLWLFSIIITWILSRIF